MCVGKMQKLSTTSTPLGREQHEWDGQHSLWTPCPPHKMHKSWTSWVWVTHRGQGVHKMWSTKFRGKKGKICHKREQKTVAPIGDFMKNCHIPHLKKHSQHHPTMKMSSKTHAEEEREKLFHKNKDFLMRSSDCAEAFNVNCDHEICESHHGNNPSTKCKGSNARFHKTTALLITTTLPMNMMIAHNMIFTLFFRWHKTTCFH